MLSPRRPNPNPKPFLTDLSILMLSPRNPNPKKHLFLAWVSFSLFQYFNSIHETLTLILTFTLGNLNEFRDPLTWTLTLSISSSSETFWTDLSILILSPGPVYLT